MPSTTARRDKRREARCLRRVPAGGIHFRRGCKICPEGSQTRWRVWEMALERGAYTIEDDTKEKTEFNLGKNFL